MLIVNKFIKFLGYSFIHLVLLIGMYITSLVFTAPILCITESVMNIVHPVIWFQEKFYITYLLCSIPLCIAFMIYVELDVYKYHKK